jgi:hypothetical protein
VGYNVAISYDHLRGQLHNLADSVCRSSDALEQHAGEVNQDGYLANQAMFQAKFSLRMLLMLREHLGPDALRDAVKFIDIARYHLAGVPEHAEPTGARRGV